MTPGGRWDLFALLYAAAASTLTWFLVLMGNGPAWAAVGFGLVVFWTVWASIATDGRRPR